ncbi:MAG: MFS transporter [archaeon]|nr:MFS transporter [archaeon]
MQMRLFRSRQFCLSMVCCMLLYIIVMSTSVLGPMCFQMGLGYSAAESGFIMVPGTLLVAVLSPVFGGLYDRHDMRWMVVILSLVMFLSNFLMFYIDHDTPYLWLVFLGVLRGIGGAIMMPFTAWAVNSVEPRYKSDATSLNNAFRTLASAAGLAVFVGVFDSVAIGSTYLDGACQAFLLISLMSIIMLVLGLFSRKNTAEKVD